MDKGGGTELQTSTSTSTSAPPGYISSALRDIVSRGQDLSETPREFFPGSTVVDYSPETEQALGLLTGLANTPSGMTEGGIDAINELLTTPGVTPQNIVDASETRLAEVVPGLQGMFARAGRAGSGLAADALGAGVARTMGDVGRELDRDRLNRISTGLSFAPGFENMRQLPAELLAGVGAAREGKEQERLMEEAVRHDFSQNEARQRLAEFAGLLQGVGPLAGGTTEGSMTVPVQQQSSGLGQLLGAGLSMGLAPFTGGGSLFSTIFRPAAAAGMAGGFIPGAGLAFG